MANERIEEKLDGDAPSGIKPTKRKLSGASAAAAHKRKVESWLIWLASSAALMLLLCIMVVFIVDSRADADIRLAQEMLWALSTSLSLTLGFLFGTVRR